MLFYMHLAECCDFRINSASGLRKKKNDFQHKLKIYVQLSKQYPIYLKIYVQTNNTAHNIHYVSLKYTFNTNRGMSTISLIAYVTSAGSSMAENWHTFVQTSTQNCPRKYNG
jgi:hypothetical protein